MKYNESYNNYLNIEKINKNIIIYLKYYYIYNE